MITRKPISLLTALATVSLAGVATVAFSFAQPDEQQNGLLKDAAFAGASVGKPEVFARFDGPVPVGVAVAPSGRTFVSFPRTMDQGPQTLGELKNGKVVPYPSDAMNALGASQDAEHLVSVQGITIDNQNRLWALDTGKIMDKPIAPGSGATKLVCIDLATDKVMQTVVFPAEVAGANAYLNDVRVSPFQGEKGTAFISDSSTEGPNGIVVVDLATGKSMRRLNDQPSVKAAPSFTAIVEGQQLLVRKPGKQPTYDTTGVDGIALSGDGSRLYYCANAGHQLFSVGTAALADRSGTDDAVSVTVQFLGSKLFASDGIEADASGRLFLTDYEHDAIQMRASDGTYTTVARQRTMVWPDSISVGGDGYLYYTSNQLDRRTQFHNGHDRRVKPYVIYRLPMPGLTPQAAAWKGKSAS